LKKAIIIVSIVALLGTAAYFYYQKQATVLQDEAGYEITRISADKLDMDESIFGIQMKITNPSTLQARIVSLEIDVYLNKILISKINDNGSFVLPAKGFTFVDLHAVFSPNEIYGKTADILQLTVQLKDAVIDLKGKAKVLLGGFIPFTLPIQYSTSARSIIHK
jgi:LEA14-like dessication related protein